jgi:hypothetical protein
VHVTWHVPVDAIHSVVPPDTIGQWLVQEPQYSIVSRVLQAPSEVPQSIVLAGHKHWPPSNSLVGSLQLHLWVSGLQDCCDGIGQSESVIHVSADTHVLVIWSHFSPGLQSASFLHPGVHVCVVSSQYSPSLQSELNLHPGVHVCVVSSQYSPSLQLESSKQPATHVCVVSSQYSPDPHERLFTHDWPIVFLICPGGRLPGVCPGFFPVSPGGPP